MATINAHYLELPGSYLFSEIARKVKEYVGQHPQNALVRLGIGDVTQPLSPAVITALNKATEEQAYAQGFRGYGPEQGYDFLRNLIAETCFDGLGITPEDIFVSDGAKCDIGNFQELFSDDCRIAITDPVYPVYCDSNVMAGRAGSYQKSGPEAGKFSRLIYLPCTAENNFVPALPAERPDLIYLCYPNNPTGTVLTKEQLAVWVNYARENDCVILFDAAYEAYISTPGIPRSIYEIEGAREVAVEFRSYSKHAGFTGLRCGYVVVPETVTGKGPDGERVSLRALWNRRTCTKYNGCPYIVQRAAEAALLPEGAREVAGVIDIYMKNARLIREGFTTLGLSVVGGVDSPYVWVRIPKGMTSWGFFDLLLKKAEVVGTPGSGFGPSGEGYFRLTGFGSPEKTVEALQRISKLAL